MKAAAIITTVVAVLAGAGPVMARGVDISQRVGAFQKGGPGIAVRAADSKQRPAYRAADRKDATRQTQQVSSTQFKVDTTHR
jgi:hypothetical protein